MPHRRTLALTVALIGAIACNCVNLVAASRAAGGGAAQAVWRWQHPLPPAIPFPAVSYPSTTTCYVAGSRGLVIRAYPITLAAWEAIQAQARCRKPG